MKKSFGHPNDVSIPSSIHSPALAASFLGCLRQRIHDWRHERRIKRLSCACREAYDAGDKAMAYMLDAVRMDAIVARSPAQIARMEQRMGLR